MNASQMVFYLLFRSRTSSGIADAMPPPSPRELPSICETEGVYRSTTLPTSAGEVGTTPSTARSVLRLTVKATLRPAAKSG